MGVSSSPPDSQTSSIEGVFASDGSSHKTSHPFKIIEHDALSLQSMTSLGRVGRLLSGMSDTGKVTTFPKKPLSLSFLPTLPPLLKQST